MNKKIVIETNKPLVDGELLLYKNGKVETVSIHELLPEYQHALETISAQGDAIKHLAKLVKELRGEEDEESN